MKREARHWVPDALWDVPKDELTGFARAVYVALSRCVKGGRAEAQPSVARLMRMTTWSRVTVLAALAQLEKRRFVVVTRRMGALNVYRMTAEAEWATSLPQRPVEEWATSLPQRPVEHQSATETGLPEEPNRSTETPGPVYHADPLGSTAGSTAGSGADASALSKPDKEAVKKAGLTADQTDEFVALRSTEPGTSALELIGKSRRAVARRAELDTMSQSPSTHAVNLTGAPE